jgi:hypothetical protein
MSAVHALKLARAAGVRIGIDGDALTLDADAAPPTVVLDLLARYKAQVIALLRPGRDGWSSEDWRAFFDERAGIAEFDGGLPRAEAEMSAYDHCVTKYMALNPPADLGGYDCRPGHEHDGPTTARHAEARAAITAALTPMKEPSP